MSERISVVIPCRNGGLYLRDAIASVLAEAPDEIIVVDDGSEDDSAAIAGSFGGIVRVHRQSGLGAPAARNAGVRLAKDGYIGFLDADDLWPAGSLSSRRNLLRAQPGLAAAYGHVAQFFSADLAAQERAKIICPPGTQAARLPSSMLFRRDVFARIGLFDERLAIGDMFDFMARFADAGLFAEPVPQTVLARRIHARNMMRGGTASAAYLPILKTVLDRRRAVGLVGD